MFELAGDETRALVSQTVIPTFRQLSRYRATDQKPQASQDLRHLLAVSQTNQLQSTTT